jgi:hypothetical protein
VKEQFDGAVHAGFLIPRSCNSNMLKFGSDRFVTDGWTRAGPVGPLFTKNCSQADLAKARIMYSRALVGYDKVIGPDHPRSRSLQDNLCALNTVTENKALIDVREPVNKFQRETSLLGAKGTLSESKRYKLLKKLGLR